ncbi:CBS [Actinidia rufa]|uniref:CBS n=1 Tax=Actinidia rufa TaxID=165716 RepID=A0A7J0F7F6_9ERIC|nr:CBS [Actinidia rufa]
MAIRRSLSKSYHVSDGSAHRVPVPRTASICYPMLHKVQAVHAYGMLCAPSAFIEALRDRMFKPSFINCYCRKCQGCYSFTIGSCPCCCQKDARVAR